MVGTSTHSHHPPIRSRHPQADANGGALYLAGGATALLDSGSVTMANNEAADGEDIFVTSATLTCETTCVANQVPSTPCTDAELNAGTAACPLDCGACNTCPAEFASTVVGSVDASGCKAANCEADEYVGVDGTWYVLYKLATDTSIRPIIRTASFVRALASHATP